MFAGKGRTIPKVKLDGLELKGNKTTKCIENKRLKAKKTKGCGETRPEGKE